MARRRKLDVSVTRLRSAITNGRYVLHGVDHRGAEMRRLKDLVALHVSDLGGDKSISHSEMVLVQRASMLVLQCEMMEAKFDRGEATPNQLELYGKTANTLRRILQALGIQRRAKDITPSLNEYLRGRSNGRTIDHDPDEATP